MRLARFASLARMSGAKTSRSLTSGVVTSGVVTSRAARSEAVRRVLGASAASAILIVTATLLVATVASAQVTPKKRPAKPAPENAGQTVEIRGQVPTPQVVTVRPRAVPDYSRGVLVPAFYDQHFWPSILAPYRVVPTLPTESTHRPPEATPDTAAASPPPSRE